MAQQLQNLQSKEEKAEAKTTFWERNQDKIIWGVIGIALTLFYYLLKSNGFPDFLN
jgi:hypothetical protein